MNPFSLPTHVRFIDPSQALATLNDRIQRAKCVLFLSDTSVEALDLKETVRNWTSQGAIWISRSPKELTVEALRQVLAKLNGHPIDQIMVVGDPILIDLAKTIHWLLPIVKGDETEAQLNCLLRQKPLGSRPSRLPLWAIPTTFSCGNALSFRVDVIDERHHSFICIEDPALAAESAWIVPAWMDSSKESILNAGLLSLSQAGEAYWATSTGPLIQSLSIQAIRLIVKNMLVILLNPNQPQARQAFLAGCLQAAMAQNNTGVGAAHDLALALRLKTEINLSVSSVLTLPDFLKLNLGQLTHPENLYEAFNINNPQELRSWLQQTSKGILSLSLAETGLSDDALMDIATTALEGDHHKLNPVPLTPEWIHTILKLHL